MKQMINFRPNSRLRILKRIARYKQQLLHIDFVDSGASNELSVQSNALQLFPLYCTRVARISKHYLPFP